MVISSIPFPANPGMEVSRMSPGRSASLPTNTSSAAGAAEYFWKLAPERRSSCVAQPCTKKATSSGSTRFRSLRPSIQPSSSEPPGSNRAAITASAVLILSMAAAWEAGPCRSMTGT
jgi:hypothetical protein